ncbi:MAG: GNAT family N-acetyltransferase [Chitinophagaceae bacterium]|nr:GNAT family N-acetyltransferase [Chitinophagaceae bacterium]
MQTHYQTNRLTLKKLSAADAAFIYELVNSPGWIEFIGDRNVHTVEDAITYINKINNNNNIIYWSVQLKDSETSIGVITFIKRDYLDHHDIGFAFLPQHAKKGYAFEAAKIVLDDALNNPLHPVILANTLPHNKNSVSLLEKLGFVFQKEIEAGNEKLLLFSVKKNK